MDTTFEQARGFFQQGVGHYEAGRMAEAERVFAAALALVPGRPSVLANLGATRLKLGRAEEALALLDEALAQEPGDLHALGHRATALAELGQLPQALAAFDALLAREPRHAEAWTHRGSLLRELGRSDDAIASFEQALAHGGDAELLRFYIAALRGQSTPVATPSHYVQALFDGYARQFDDHLVQALRYDAPQVLAAHLATLGHRFGRALDLGCGTGLCGPLVRPLVDAIDGVDLSGGMLERARALGMYDVLEQADLVAYLGSTARRYGLVLAADVMIYVGELAPVFAGVARVLEPGGVFCLTLEEAPAGQDLVLRPSLRHAHGEGYLRRMAAQQGLVVERLERRPVREEQRVPIPGLFAWMSLKG